MFYSTILLHNNKLRALIFKGKDTCSIDITSKDYCTVCRFRKCMEVFGNISNFHRKKRFESCKPGAFARKGIECIFRLCNIISKHWRQLHVKCMYMYLNVKKCGIIWSPWVFSVLRVWLVLGITDHVVTLDVQLWNIHWHCLRLGSWATITVFSPIPSFSLNPALVLHSCHWKLYDLIKRPVVRSKKKLDIEPVPTRYKTQLFVQCIKPVLVRW